MKQTTSSVLATSPAQQAEPKPRIGSSITNAPKSAAHCPEPSIDPLSTTIERYPSGIRESTQGKAATSSRTGRMTSGILGPYSLKWMQRTLKRLRIP
jgi:hypothetical protein